MIVSELIQKYFQGKTYHLQHFLHFTHRVIVASAAASSSSMIRISSSSIASPVILEDKDSTYYCLCCSGSVTLSSVQEKDVDGRVDRNDCHHCGASATECLAIWRATIRKYVEFSAACTNLALGGCYSNTELEAGKESTGLSICDQLRLLYLALLNMSFCHNFSLSGSLVLFWLGEGGAE